MKTCPQCRANAAEDVTFCHCGYCFPPPSTSGATPPNLPATAQLGGMPLVFAGLFLAGAIFLIRECASRDPEVNGA